MKQTDKNERGVPFREKLMQRLDLPPDLLPGETLVEIRGQNALSLKGGGRILLYTPQEIRVSLKNSKLVILGERLICTSYCAGAIGVEGRIEGVFFEEGTE